ncbi:MAG: ATP-binding protein [Thermoplasmata archaeon]|nr:ATP-binding protein [Thermoplasmata archaeon]
MIISRDVVGRYKVKFVRDLKEMAFYLISNFSSRISYNKLKNIFRVKSVHTIKNYISYLEDAYMVFQLFPFSCKVKYQLMQVKKIYSIDTGLIEALSPGSSKNLGRIMENVVAVDILRREPRENVFFYLTPRHEEVDFVIREGMKIKQLIQVTYASGRDEIEKREIRSLIKASDELKCKNLSLITWDYEDELKIEDKTIRCIPLWKWLLR